MAGFKHETLTGIPAALTELASQLTLVGATIHTINGSSTAPAADNQITREFIAIMPGKAPGLGNAAHHVLGFGWVDVQSSVPLIRLWGGTGIKGPVAIATVTYSTTTATVVTTAAHGFSTGDVVFFNGTDNVAHNQCSSVGNNPIGITVVNSTTFTVPMFNSSSGTSNGGMAYALYNYTGLRTGETSAGCRLAVSNAAMKVYGYVDEFGIQGYFEQSALRYPFALGLSDRRHVQGAQAMIAKLTAQVVSTGVSTAYSLDRSAGFYTGSKVQAVSPNSAVPATISIAKTALGIVTATQVSPTQVNLTLPAGTYPVGTLIGLDPCPLYIAGDTQTNLDSLIYYASHNNDGSRGDSNAQPYVITLDGATLREAEGDPDAAGAYSSAVVNLTRLNQGWRGGVPGLIAIAKNTQNDLDIAVGGDPATSPANDFFTAAAMSVGSTAWIPGYGPGAA